MNLNYYKLYDNENPDDLLTAIRENQRETLRQGIFFLIIITIVLIVFWYKKLKKYQNRYYYTHEDNKKPKMVYSSAVLLLLSGVSLWSYMIYASDDNHSFYLTLAIVILNIASLFTALARNKTTPIILNTLSAIFAISLIASSEEFPVGVFFFVLFTIAATIVIYLSDKDFSFINNFQGSSNNSRKDNIHDLDILKKYKELLDIGAISEDEYNERKEELLSNSKKQVFQQAKDNKSYFNDIKITNDSSNKWICTKCGTTNLSNQKFCKDCGEYKPN